MTTLICGSLAFDTIMVFHGRFAENLLPDQIHILNVSFLVPELRREFGGCAGNIAYNLALLGGEPLLMASVGEDAQPYLDRLEQLGLDPRFVRRVEGTFTAQAFITTDLDDNQITAFHPGAMSHSHINHVGQAQGVELGIVAPDGREGMLQHAREFAEAAIPFVFDPGQGLPMFSPSELSEFITLAHYVTVNDYEAKLLSERLGRSMEHIAASGKTCVVTLGAQGSVIYTPDEIHRIPAVAPSQLADPTGCGDAYRGGLLYGITHGLDWETTGRLASTLGSIKIAHQGPQNHAPSRAQIAEHFKTAFGYAPW